MKTRAQHVAVCGTACLVLACVLGTTAAHARQKIPASFLGLRTLGLDPQEVESLQGAMRVRLQANAHYHVSLRSDLKLTDRCKADLRCYCRATREQRRVRRVIYGNVGRIEAIYSFELVLVDTQNCSVDNSVFTTEKLDRHSAGQRLAGLAQRLLKPPESVSQTAAKAERDIDAVPALVTVVTGKQIQQLGIDRLPELLRLVPGFEVIDTNWGDRVLHHGLTSTVLYMVDGVPLSNAKFNLSTLGRDFRLGLNHVERVEVIRGPGSVLWGQNAFLGIVNLITRSPNTKREQLRAHVRLGTLNTQEFHASVGATRRWLSYFLSTSFRRTEGPRTRVDNSLFATQLAEGVTEPIWGNGGTTDNEADTQFDVAAKVQVARRLEILFHYITQKTSFEISPFGALLPPDDRGFWDTTDILYAASWTDSLPRGFRYRLSGSRYEHRSWENYIVFPKTSQLPFGFSSLQGNRLRPEINHLAEGRLYHTLQIGSLTNQALVGLSFLHQQMPEQFATITTGQQQGREALDISSNSFVTISAYAQDDLSLLSDRLVFSGGVRYDHHDPFQSAVSAQGAIIAGVERLRAKLMYTEGFRPPSMNSLYSTKGTLGNKSLKPERSRSGALEVTGRPFGPLMLKAGGAISQLTNLIRTDNITDPDLLAQGFAYRPINQGTTMIYSGHGELSLTWPIFNAFVNYAFKHLDTDTPIPFANHTVSGGASFRPLNDFNAFATASVVSPFYVSVLQAGVSDGGRRLQIDPRLVITAGVTFSNLLNLFDFTIKVRNPTRYSYRSPYRLDDEPTPLLERRRVTEVLFTLGASATVPWK